jgi:hypothetical protein
MAIPLAALPAIVQGAGSLAQLVGGAASLVGQERPEYEMPEGLRQSFALARARVTDPYMTGYGKALDNLNLSAVNAMKAASQTGGGAESIASVHGAMNQGANQLAIANEESQDRDYQHLDQVLGAVAQDEQLQFQMNEFAPYAQRQQEGRDIVGAGFENLFGAADKFGLMSLAEKYGQGGTGRQPTSSLVMQKLNMLQNNAANLSNNFFGRKVTMLGQ